VPFGLSVSDRALGTFGEQADLKPCWQLDSFERQFLGRQQTAGRGEDTDRDNK